MAKALSVQTKPTASDGVVTGRTAIQIMSSLEAAIRRGTFAAGEALPPIRALADKLGVNRNTVASAYRQLSDAGLIEGRGRQGSRVAAPGMGATKPPPFIYDMGAGNPDPQLLPDVFGALQRCQWRHRDYDDAPDEPALLEYATQQFRQDSIPIGDIWISNGTFDAIAVVLRATVPKGSPIAVEDPCFMTTLGLLRELGYQPVPIAVDDEGAIPQSLDQALKSGVKAAILTPRAQNPYGGSWSTARQKELAAVIARYKDVLIIEDDHFSALSQFKPATLVSDDRPNWVVIRSVSKYVGADMRLAFVNSSKELGPKVIGLSAFTYRWVSSILQKTLHATISAADYEATIRKASELYKKRRETFVQTLAKFGIESHGADGINVWIPVEHEQFTAQRLMEAGWIVRTGSIFRLNSPPGIRLTTSTITKSQSVEFAKLLSSIQQHGARVQRSA
ncbi:aminotransferase class I/II-fold pyridoxal phosphate-dependent enzyme [Afipia carboxidovorans]|uniref:aminotransferase class I/II-fold pyridoxal phosphate-dependent enzyme n=1 Tax=Afipia carboxidovorans TaxID=40137 RepID=UPI00308CB8B4|nr:transcriptional regulator PtsJ [Afipia carboxidovorans]